MVINLTNSSNEVEDEGLAKASVIVGAGGVAAIWASFVGTTLFCCLGCGCAF